MNYIWGIIIILSGIIGVVISGLEVFWIIKLAITGNKCVGTIVDFIECRYKTRGLHTSRVQAYPIVSYHNEEGVLIESRTINSLKDKRRSSWEEIRNSYIGQCIEITYVDGCPGLFKCSKGFNSFNEKYRSYHLFVIA